MAELREGTLYVEVFDMIASLAFYRDLLGFDIVAASPEVETREGRFPHFVRLQRDGVGIMLNTAYDSNERPADRSEVRWAGTRHVCLYVECDDVAALYAELTARGLRAGPPARTRYGFLAFSASDPDGYGIVFQQPG